MSIPYPEAGPEGGPRRGLLILRFVAAIGSIVSLSSLWLSEQARVVDDLQLSAEATARPGEDLALRAFYLRDVEAPRGPSLEVTAVSVRLRDARDREIARVQLRPARGDPSMEGSIRIPANARGGLVLEARAGVAGRTALVSRRGLEAFPDAPRLVPRWRQVSLLQQQALGALVSRASGGEAFELLPRVLGGACVPEQVCRVLVWIGGPGARLALRHDSAVTEQGPARPEHETAGFSELSLLVHGPEAVVVLEARTQHGLVAERSLRLPVALGEASLSVADALVEARHALPLSVLLPPGRTQGIVDVYVQGRWRATRGFVARDDGVSSLSLPADWFVPGLVRLQAHADRFAGEGAGTRLVYVRAPGATLERSLQQLAALVREQAPAASPTDAWALQLPAAALADAQRSAAFLLATLEQTRVPLPRAASSRPRELRRLARAQTALRFGVGAVLALSALVVGMTLMRRGLRADAEATAILDQAEREAGVDPGLDATDGRQEPRAGTLFVVCLVLVVALAFLAAALLIVAKPLWF